MEWPSTRVPPGGLFQPARVQYSRETHQLIKELMQESKMSMFQRQKVNYFLRTGESLPNKHRSRSSTRQNRNSQIVISNRPSQLRSHSTIINSGTYERDKYVRQYPIPNRTEDIKRLQDFMEYGRQQLEKVRLNKPKPKPKEQPKLITRYEELKNEIDERLQWLQEMEELGEGKRYRLIIQQQVAEKLREMDKIQNGPD